MFQFGSSTASASIPSKEPFSFSAVATPNINFGAPTVSVHIPIQIDDIPVAPILTFHYSLYSQTWAALHFSSVILEMQPMHQQLTQFSRE